MEQRPFYSSILHVGKDVNTTNPNNLIKVREVRGFCDSDLNGLVNRNYWGKTAIHL